MSPSNPLRGPPAELSFEVLNSQDWRPQQEDGLRPVFLASQKVYGHIHIRYRDANCYQQGDVLQVKLIGTYCVESLVVNHPCSDNRARKMRCEEILNMTNAFKVYTPLTDNSTQSLSECIGFSFRACQPTTATINFGSPGATIEDHIEAQYGTINYKYLKSIPSSTQTRFACSGRTTADDDSHLELRIIYKLQALLLRAETNEKVACNDLEITILDDSHGRQPPTFVADFGSEYCLWKKAAMSRSQTQDLVRRIRRQATGSPGLFLNATEPRPLVFDRFKQYATTVVPMTCTFVSTFHDRSMSTAPNTAKVTWTLQKSMFSSFSGLQKPPTLRDIANKRDMVVRKVAVGRSKTYRCCLRDWQEDVQDRTHSSQPSLARSTMCKDDYSRNLPSKAPLPGQTASDAEAPVSGEQNQSVSSTRFTIACPPNQSSSTRTSTSTLDESSKDIDMDIIPEPPARSIAILLPIDIPLASLQHPTSFTSYMAVRYSLLIHVRATIENDSSTAGKGSWRLGRNTGSWAAEARLQVPVQIVYEMNGSDDQELEETSNAETACAIGETSISELTGCLARGEEKVEELPSYTASTGITY